jgi:predicted ArsR family transcriptional regulator
MSDEASRLAAVSSLEDPVRARLYRLVSASAAPLGRDAAAAAAGIGRPLAAYHLDKLIELGLLTATYQRPGERGGPGAGRPAKLYARSGREFSVSVPAREYELAARLLAIAVEADSAGSSRAALKDAARQYGQNLARQATPATAADTTDRLQDVLRSRGFEPWQDREGAVRLRNCPFHSLASLHPDLVCGMNVAMIDGLVAGLGGTGLHPDLDPRAGQCCVVIGTHDPSTTGSS